MKYRTFPFSSKSFSVIVFCFSLYSTLLVGQNEWSFLPGTIHGDQVICEGDLPRALELNINTVYSDITYQWQRSVGDQSNFVTISQTGLRLPFSEGYSWNPVYDFSTIDTPYQSTFYRVVATDLYGQTKTSSVAEIKVYQQPEIVQTTASNGDQFVCPNTPIIDVVFETRGDVGELLASGLENSGLTFSGPVNGQYTLSGIPTKDVEVSLNTALSEVSSPTVGQLICPDATYQYNIVIEKPALQPLSIRKVYNHPSFTIYQEGDRWINNGICNPPGTSTTKFYAEQDPNQLGFTQYEWQLLPADAGTINTLTGLVEWNNGFTGAATIRVRALGCGGNSDWTEAPLEVFDSSVLTTSLDTPQIFIGPIPNNRYSVFPECEFTEDSDESYRFTQFNVSAQGQPSFPYIYWSIENITPEGSETIPGILYTALGLIRWNTNFWGGLDIVATATNCDGTASQSSRLSLYIKKSDRTVPSLLVSSTAGIPDCPPESGQYSQFKSNLPVDWELQSSAAGRLEIVDDYTLNLYWIPGFFGTVALTAKASESCSIGEESLIVTVPEPAAIELISENSEEIKLCQRAEIEPFQYRITGYANQASIEGLPSGITSEITRKHHKVRVDLDKLSSSRLFYGTYRLNVMSRDYQVVVNRGEVAYLTNLLEDLLNLIELDQAVPFTASIENNSLLITASLPGVDLNPYFVYYDYRGLKDLNYSVIETIQEPERILTISGKAEAEPGTYDYTLKTEGGGENCSQASIAGRITITGLSSSTLSPSSDDGQIICFGEPIADIKYEINNALEATASDLPAGVIASFDAANKVLILSGTPSERVTQTTVYTYQIITRTNLNGCTPESTQSGTITINPPQEIQLLSDIGSDEQIICNSTNSLISPIIYQLDAGSNYYETSGIPQGVEVHFDPLSKKITLTGRPSVTTDQTTLFNYSLTTTGNQCSTKTVTGTITVQALPRLELLSERETVNQIEENAVCWNSSIVPIVFELQNANSFNISGLPEGLVTVQSGNRITISGTPTAITSNTTRYNFTLTPLDENCAVDESYSGLIEVVPLPKIKASFIQKNDLTHVSCFGHADGSILIPETKPDFDLRIHGGQNPTFQKDHIVLNNQPVVGDVYTVLINGISFTHTVINSSFGGTVQTVSEIANELIAQINRAEDHSSVPLKSSFISPSTIELLATAPTVSYTISATLATTYTGAVTPSVEVVNLTSISNSSYSYSWIGPNGFKSSDLSIVNLEAGTYFLEVSYENCTSERASFTIEAPDPITIDTETCKGILQTTISGGTGPYQINLYNSSNTLLQTDYTTSVQNYRDLVPGLYYLLEVKDAQCSIPTQQSIQLPYELTFDETIPLVVDDFCNDSKGDGFIELGGNSGGEAFSGGSNRFTYTWRGGPSGSFYANTRDIYELEPGIYTVTVTDQELGCIENQSFTIEGVDELVITPTTRTEFNANGKIELLCAEDETAFIEITAAGGLGNYTYAWQKNGTPLVGKSQPKLESLGVGSYTVFVNDAPTPGISASLNACQASYDFEVIAPQALSVIVNGGITTQVFCPGVDNPSLEIEIQGGIPPFQVTLNKGQAGSFTVPNHERFIYSNLNLNETGLKYEIEVIDANGCTSGVSSQTTIRYEALQSVEFKGSVFPIDCIEGNLGRIELELITGKLEDPEQVQLEWISPYSHIYHTWETNQGRLENIEFGGTYQAKITYKGCELYNESFRINEANESVYLSSVHVDEGGCKGETGSISLAIAGGNPPYAIEWQQYKTYTSQEPSISETVSSSTSSTSISGNPTITQQDWVTLPQFADNAILEGLNPGAYRAIVRDASASFETEVCRPYVISDVLTIGRSQFDITQLILRNEKSCNSSNTTAELQFSVINTLPNPKGIDYELEILLDTKSPGTDLIKLNEQTYQITGIGVGSHLLEIKTGTSSQVLEDFAKCSILYAFEVEAEQPISYNGPVEIALDPCGNPTPITILPTQISGGEPFEFDTGITYDFYWNFRPAQDDAAPTYTPQYVGPTISDAQEGVYELRIKDRLGCESDPILITVYKSEDSLPFSVSGSLIDPNKGEEPVKTLAPTCNIQKDGQIGIAIEGGARPYSIFWYQEQLTPASDTSSSTTAYILLEQFSNATSISGLESGKYRVRIVSQNQSCENNSERYDHLFYQEELIVPANNDLTLVEGPFIDENLCQLKPGKLLLEVFDNQEGDLTFYYNNELIAYEEQSNNNENKLVTLFIEHPVEQADLVITNNKGCQLIDPLFLSEIGVPNFTYTTPSLEAEGVLLAKEEITFTNTSEPPFYYSEWNFGDGSQTQQIQTDGLSNPVIHSYGIAGTYYVTLRNYSRLGCFKEYTEQLLIGKGYNIIAPNAFTPNGDLYNDHYRILFSGFERVLFKIFNDRGDLLHSEAVQQLPENTTIPLALIGWDGQNETGSSFYTYSFQGILITDQSEITQSGNFVLIK